MNMFDMSAHVKTVHAAALGPLACAVSDVIERLPAEAGVRMKCLEPELCWRMDDAATALRAISHDIKAS